MIYLGVSAVISLGIGWLFRLGVNLQAITAIIGASFFIGAIYYVWVKNRYEIKA